MPTSIAVRPLPSLHCVTGTPAAAIASKTATCPCRAAAITASATAAAGGADSFAPSDAAAGRAPLLSLRRRLLVRLARRSTRSATCSCS